MKDDKDIEELSMEEENEDTKELEELPIEEENDEVNEEEKKDKKETLEELKEKNKKSKGFIFFLIILIVAIVGAGGYFTYKQYFEKKTDKKINTKVKKVSNELAITSNELVDFDLYFMKLENELTNKVYSPLSIKYALEMLGEGAEGDSRKQIESVIGDYESKKYVNSNHMSFANALYIKNSFKDYVNENYTKKLMEKYNAEVLYDSFESPDAVNSWISNKTFNLIDNLFDNINDKDFILINALAIDMEWVNRIQKLDGDSMPYYSVSFNHEDYSHYVNEIDGVHFNHINFGGKEVNVHQIGATINNYDIIKDLGEDNIRNTITNEYNEFIKTSDCWFDDTETFVNKFIKELGENYHKYKSSTDFYLYNDDKVKMFAKDLKEYDGTTLQYVGIMPKEENLNDYISKIKADDINDLIPKLKVIRPESFKEGKIYKITGNIPVFNFEYKLDLMNDLKKLGITDVFNKKSNLSGISKKKQIIIDSAEHKANIDFSNDGIKAAATTVLGGRGSASCEPYEHLYEVPVEEIDMTFDKPYLFLVRDKESGEVWFTGTVYEPTEYKEVGWN